MDKTKKLPLLLIALLVLAITGFGCTKKDNLTGINWAGGISLTFTDATAIQGGYSFVADTLSSADPGLKCLLVGNWQGSDATSLLRFTALPEAQLLNEYHSITDARLEMVVLRRDKLKEPLRLQFYKLLRSYVQPDSLLRADLQHFAELSVPHEISSPETLRLDISADWLKNWQSEADSTGLNIYISLDDGQEGFVELRMATYSDGAKLSFDYQKNSESDTESFSTYAITQDIAFHPSPSENEANTLRVSNFRFQRAYIDLNPDFTRFVDFDGAALDSLSLKRVNINKAELILHIKDLPNKDNTYSYFLKSYLVKERPDSLQSVLTADLESISFYQSLQKVVNNTADSVAIDITPIIQAYSAGKKLPKGIVIKSSYEKNDFGELEFYHPLDSEPALLPYIRVKYSLPYL